MIIKTNQTEYRVELLTVARSELGREWCRKPGQDPFTRFYLVVDGYARVNCRHRDYELRPGTLCLIPSHMNIGYNCPEQVTIWWLHFNAWSDDGYDVFDSLSKPLLFTTSSVEPKIAAFERLHELFPFIELAAALQGHARLFELLTPVCERAGIVVETETDRRRQKFATALRYIGQNLNEPNPVGSIAAAMNQHPSQFSRQFKQAFGVSPVQYIQRRRIAIAARLLLSTDRKLYDIASELGFSDGFHLSKTFKRIIGQSPAAYRRSNPHHQP